MPKKPATPKALAERIEKLEEVVEGELTEREGRFVEAFVAGGVGTKSVIAAGYSKAGANVQAIRLLSRPRVQQAIAARRAEASAQAEVDAVWIRKQLKQEALAPESPAAARVKSLELLGKLDGLFIEKVEVTDKLTEEERRRRLLAFIKIGKEQAKG